MTKKQAKSLYKYLEMDILERYNNSAYWNYDFIDEFAQDNGLEKEN